MKRVFGFLIIPVVLALTLGLYLITAAPAQETTAAALKVVSTQTLPERPLRGYGTLAATFTQYAAGDAHASLLRIQCDDVQKAQIVHGKYLSDLHLLGPVQDSTLTIGAVTLPVTTATDQGTISAVRSGSAVYVMAAERAADIPALFTAIPAADRAKLTITPDGTVPMFLDSWDKYGFRFYYRPWETPSPGGKKTQWKDYHVLGEFDFAKQCGDMGFVFWATEDMTDLADGLNNDPMWDWATRAAARRKLPVVINTSTGPATWLLNRYRDDARQMAPQYSGGFYGVGESWSSGKGNLSWNSMESADVEFSVLQEYVKRYSQQDTTIEYLLPQGEMRHGDHEVLIEYGPVADRNYRKYLQQQYGTLEAVSKRWTGNPDAIQSWEDVRLPELANFLGYNSSALDLTGIWRIKPEENANGKRVPAPEAWFQPGFDDSSWKQLKAPGSDIALFTNNRLPTVFRRQFTIDPAWRARNPRIWLYVFDLARFNRNDKMPIYVNGQKVGEDAGWNGGEHWGAYEVTKAVQDGNNTVALTLMNGLFGYHCYLSGHEPIEYPYLGERVNARWVDFVRFKQWSRVEMLRRSFSAIRQYDTERSLICMSPDSYHSGIKELCEDYGGHFHNTGYMGGWWAESLPMQMRGSNLPFSVEPSEPARMPSWLRGSIGNWLTEGVNAINYFIHVGNIYWDDAIRETFLKDLPVIQTFGKHHIPKAEVAMLFTDDVENLTNFPWGRNRGDNFASGYVVTQMNVALHFDYHTDAVSDLDFADGDADAYRVIIDTNTQVMDPSRMKEIAEYVRKGGIFITLNQTGRHTPEKADAWPISELTGYKVQKVDMKQRNWAFVPGQPVYDVTAWQPKNQRANGLSLVPSSPDCQDLIRWEDGSTAVGMRKIGKGFVINMGIFYPNNPLYYRPILEWLKVGRIQMQMASPDAAKTQMTHAITNNGLYDAWIVYRWTDSPATIDLTFRDGLRPTFCYDVKAGKLLPVTRTDTECRVNGLAFEPLETRIYLTPRRALVTAPLEWVTLQRNWWRGTEKPVKLLKPYQSKFTLDLSDDWAVKLLHEDDKSDQTPLAQPGVDDTAWERGTLKVYMIPEEIPTRHALFRKSFTVPAAWKNGDIQFWLQGWQIDIMPGNSGYRIWLDGQEIRAFNAGGRAGTPGLPLADRLKPGTKHVLAVELIGDGETIGPTGHTWLYYLPRPQAKLDLSGAWYMTQDLFTYATNSVMLPGPWDGLAAKRTFVADEAQRDRNVVLHLDTDRSSGITGVIINDHWVMRLHHDIGTQTILNITPWIRFGQENEIILKCGGVRKTTVKSISLDFYDREVYP